MAFTSGNSSSKPDLDSGTSTSKSVEAKQDMKRSTAAQFFNKDDEQDKMANTNTYDIVVELLNNAAVMQKSADKIANLRKVQELILHKSPDLLDNFLDEMLAFQSDVYKDVKKFVIGFMEEACKKDYECLPKVMACMLMLLGDDDVNVQKKVILTVSSMFKFALAWIGKTRKTRPEMKAVWQHLTELKSLLFESLESTNDGIRTHVVKFLEGLCLVFSKKTMDSEIPKKNEADMSLDQVPESNEIIKIADLEIEGVKAFNSLLQFQSSPHISSINLMTVMNALSNIAKQRPGFFDQVVQSFEALHVNLPPTLAKSQVSSVRKNLKTQMMTLLKHPASVDFMPQITTLLTDLGATQSEIIKSTPRDAESRKRKALPDVTSGSASKKSKLLEVDDDDDGQTPWVDRSSKKPKPEHSQKQTAIDVTAEDILPRLTPQNVADLVLLSMVMLPDAMPALFQSTYTPIAAAGTQAQISHIARLLATQLTMAGMGKGLGELQLQALKEEAAEAKASDDEPASPKQLIQTIVGRQIDEDTITKKPKINQLPLPPMVKKIKQFQLSSITKKLNDNTTLILITQAIDRILQAEKVALTNHVDHHRTKLLATLTTLLGDSSKNNLLGYIFNDLRMRQDLAFAWLYQEYAHCQGYSANQRTTKTIAKSGYDDCLLKLLDGLIELEDHHGDSLFHRILLEAPLITDNALGIVKKYCSMPAHTEAGLKTLSQLIIHRPAHRLKFLDLLLDFTASDKLEVRNIAIKSAQKLHASGRMQTEIERYANFQLKRLLQPKPPANALKQDDVPDTWTEELIKAHLYLHLGLLPSNHKLIHELANIYTATSADIKRTILRVLEAPVKGMGMDSPELLTLVENCPKGSETLVMRVIHILTDKAVPSPELVDRIRDLYHKRVPDVRFLIPVLNGLSKNEVIEALPKLIKLNPMVVKEVFNRLMGSHVVNNESVYHSPLTPVELLVALHNIDPAKCDIKTTIKAASLCFSERNIYTQEVLAIVLQQLMEQDPLPTLLMRTVIQSMSLYPRLMGFVLNILQRLIVKKVWKQKKVWEGFIRCCQRAKPQSFQVLLQLPAAQLKDVFEVCPDLKEPLLQHVQTFTENQKAHIPKSVLAVLEEETDLLSEGGIDRGDKVNNGNESECDVHKIETTSDTSLQVVKSNLTAVKTIEGSPQSSEKSAPIKISLPSSVRQEENSFQASGVGDELELEKPKVEKSKESKNSNKEDRDEAGEQYSRRSSKSSRREDSDEEDSKSKSSSSSRSKQSSRRSSSSTSKRK
ncbi:symplekin [Biomphalaria glabrata]|uniref:Symplekin-like n=1 Tax=Biomphalaria glabrata TaxID=6526 RepID=A0A9W2ZW93_BIOGL|nr:symplekin-like [Biomphalaria glabrata]KAI8740439.1 symplekin-like [Biomphalaria glabrata]KAI8784991.1 symplekin [Biomphalaria glabrata]